MTVRRRRWSDTEHDHDRCQHWPVVVGDDAPWRTGRLYMPDEVVETPRRNRHFDHCNACRSKHRRGVPQHGEKR